MDRENRDSVAGLPLTPRDQSLSRDDPSTWTSDWLGFLTHPNFIATFTPAYLAAAKQLVAVNASGLKMANHQPSRPRLTRRNPWAPRVDKGYRPDVMVPNEDEPFGLWGDPRRKYPFELRQVGSRTTRIGYPVAIHNFPIGYGFKVDRAPARCEKPQREDSFSPHIDGGGPEDGYRTCPQSIVLEASTILEAAGVTRCGGTLVW